MMHRWLLLCLLLLPLVVAAQAEQSVAMTVAYTYQNVSGNRYLPNVRGNFPTDVQSAQMQLDGTPAWLLGGVVGEVPTWVVVMADGRVLAAQPIGDGMGVSGLAIEIAQVNPGQPIAAVFGAEGLPSVLTAGDDLSPLSHPVVVDAATNLLAYPATNGDLVFWRDGKEIARIGYHLLPDARLVVSDDGEVGAYARATDRYAHGVLGDALEGGALGIASVNEVTFYGGEIQVDAPAVLEGIAPLWADIDGDGVQELVSTVSNASSGAWLRVEGHNGGIIAESAPIGQGFRWRHQIAVAPTGIDGAPQVIEVQTPHIGGIVGYFDLRGDTLSLNNAQLGYTSHAINSANLDQAVVADFDGDGVPELVLTDQARTRLAAVVNSERGVQEVWSLPLGAALASNLSVVELPDGGVALGAVTEDGRLSVWVSG